MWEQILSLRGMDGVQVQRRWAPLHLQVQGNEEAHALAAMGRGLHPNNLIPLSKRRHVTEWDALGLEPMEDPVGYLASGDDSGGSQDSDLEPKMREGVCDSDGFSAEGNNRARERAQGVGWSPLLCDTEYSTEVSEPRRRKARRVIKSISNVAQRHGPDLKPNRWGRQRCLSDALNNVCQRLTAPCWIVCTMCVAAPPR